MNIYRHYTAITDRLAAGQPVYLSESGNRLDFSTEAPNAGKRIHFPKIGIYAGTGTSHSWIWFVELFEGAGFFDLTFLNETDIQAGRLNTIDVLAVSGGDTFAVAQSLNASGARRLAEFVRDGGIYLGACAGAYLPMNSSKKDLDLFNFAPVKITNLRKVLPEAVKHTYKFCTAYGCDYIFHPVREAVRMRVNGAFSFPVRSMTAPLYGGPAMIPCEGSEALAAYTDFTKDTDFLVSRDIASETLMGHAAAVRVPMDRGAFYLFGPHFEHPHFPEANMFLIDIILRESIALGSRDITETSDCRLLVGEDRKKLITDIRRELSNCRIVATGLEIMPINWRIGAKYYEPEKIRVFLEAMWQRLDRLAKTDGIMVREKDERRLVEHAVATTHVLRKMKRHIDKDLPSDGLATLAFEHLHRFSTSFFDMYFLTRSRTRALAREAAQSGENIGDKSPFQKAMP